LQWLQLHAAPSLKFNRRRLKPHRRCPNHSFDFFYIFEIFCRNLSEQSNIGARLIVCTIMLSTPTFALFVAIALLQVLSTATFMLSVLEKGVRVLEHLS
jgi:hypothetical protein